MTKTDEIKTAIEVAISELHKLADKIKNTYSSEDDMLKDIRTCTSDVISNIHQLNEEKQDVHAISGLSKKYEYRTLVLGPRSFERGFMSEYYKCGWEPMFSTTVSDRYGSQLLLFTVRRPVIGSLNADLLYAVEQGDTITVRRLLNNGADVNVKDTHGRTLLFNAAWHSYDNICKLLLKHNAGINDKDKYGNTPLHTAAANGHTKICKLLLEHRADVNAKNDDNSTPLHEAAGRGYTEVCKLLIEHGADMSGKDDTGNTPLHWAVAYDYTETCKLLQEHGANE